MELWELEIISTIVLEGAKKTCYQSYLLFSFMSFYGLRFSDVYNSQWIDLPTEENSVLIIQRKTGNPRRVARLIVLDGSELDVWTIRREAQKYSYSYYRTRFMILCPFLLMNDDGKKIETHLFRHVKAKRVFLETGSIKTVKTEIGVSSTSVAWGYVNSQIKKE